MKKSKKRINREQFKNAIIAVFIIAILIVNTYIYSVLWFSGKLELPFSWRGNWVVLGVYVVLLYVATRTYGGYNIGGLKRFDLIYSQTIALLFVNMITYFQNGLMMRRLPELPLFLYMSFAQFVVIMIWAFAVTYLHRKLYPPAKMLMIYGEYNVDPLIRKMNSGEDNYYINSSVCIDEGLDYIKEQILLYQGVVMCDVPSGTRNKLLKYCYEHAIRAYITPKISDVFIRAAKNVDVFDTPLLLCKNTGLSIGDRLLKRLFDILFSLCAITLFSPLMLLIALAIKIDDGGPVLFKQKRYTMNERIFSIYKFRSMIVNAEQAGQVIPTANGDKRITRVGKVIRNCRLDELPQLFNILKGDMSIVGPRPERVEHVEKYTREIPEFKYRLKVKGGLTGYAQIFGKYNTTAYDKLRLDLMYIENYSFVLDLKLILITLKILFKKDSTEGIDDGAFSLEEIYPEAIRSEEEDEGTASGAATEPSAPPASEADHTS